MLQSMDAGECVAAIVAKDNPVDQCATAHP